MNSYSAMMKKKEGRNLNSTLGNNTKTDLQIENWEAEQKLRMATVRRRRYCRMM